MDSLFALLFLLSPIAFVVGLVKPNWVLPWDRTKTRRRAALTYGTSTIVFFILTGLTTPENITQEATVPSVPTESTPPSPPQTPASSPRVSETPSEQSQTVDAAPSPSPPQTPASSPRVSKTPSEQSQTVDVAPAKAAIIPGIAAVDVYGNMKDAGLQCSGPVVIGAIVKWKCEESTSDHLYSVDVTGRSPSEIEVVSATSLNFGSQNTNTVARDFLSYVATVPYDGSSRAAAKAWVQENVGTQEVEKTFGSVRIQLFGDARARILRMAPAETQ